MWTRSRVGRCLPQATNLLTACTLGRITASPLQPAPMEPATLNWVHLHSAALHCTSGQGGQPTACPGGHPGAPYRSALRPEAYCNRTSLVQQIARPLQLAFSQIIHPPRRIFVLALRAAWSSARSGREHICAGMGLVPDPSWSVAAHGSSR